MNKLLIPFLLISAVVKAQDPVNTDHQAILSMCGCYEVTFNFAETFAADPDYTFYPNYRSGGLEYVFPVVAEQDRIILQHLLIVGDTMIIKHWRQDWLFENTDLYTFDMDNTWQYNSRIPANVSGQWSQSVYQVDDSPRYAATGTWIHADGRSYWEATADAPLPRREFSKRSDYNVMTRRNRHELTSEGWVHEQDNDKVIRTEEGDRLLAREKGWNTYVRTTPSRCQVAADWWSDNQEYWSNVRFVWDELFAGKQTIQLQKQIDGLPLFIQLFTLQEEAKQQTWTNEFQRDRIRSVIGKYLIREENTLSFSGVDLNGEE